MKKSIVPLVFLLAFGGCTVFFGHPHVSFPACANLCRADGLRVAQLQHHGEFASTCVCEMPPRQPQ